MQLSIPISCSFELCPRAFCHRIGGRVPSLLPFLNVPRTRTCTPICLTRFPFRCCCRQRLSSRLIRGSSLVANSPIPSFDPHHPLPIPTGAPLSPLPFVPPPFFQPLDKLRCLPPLRKMAPQQRRASRAAVKAEESPDSLSPTPSTTADTGTTSRHTTSGIITPATSIGDDTGKANTKNVSTRACKRATLRNP